MVRFVMSTYKQCQTTIRTPHAVFSRVAQPRGKIPVLVFMSEKKIELTVKSQI